MDDIDIVLTCGFTTKYKNLKDKSGNIKCDYCKIDHLNVEECLNLAKNRIEIRTKEFEIETNKFKEESKNLDSYKNDPRFFIDLSLEKIKQEIDLRREVIKLEFNNKLDEYCNCLMKQIEQESQLKHFNFENNMQKINLLSKNIDDIKIEDDYDIEKKIQFMNNKVDLVCKQQNLAKNIGLDLTKETIRLGSYNSNFDFEKIFGKIRKNLLEQEETDIKIINPYSEFNPYVMMMSPLYDNEETGFSDNLEHYYGTGIPHELSRNTPNKRNKPRKRNEIKYLNNN